MRICIRIALSEITEPAFGLSGNGFAAKVQRERNAFYQDPYRAYIHEKKGRGFLSLPIEARTAPRDDVLYKQKAQFPCNPPKRKT